MAAAIFSLALLKALSGSCHLLPGLPEGLQHCVHTGGGETGRGAGEGEEGAAGDYSLLTQAHQEDKKTYSAGTRDGLLLLVPGGPVLFLVALFGPLLVARFSSATGGHVQFCSPDVTAARVPAASVIKHISALHRWE